MLNRETSGARWRTRPDGPDKVAGPLAYLSDLTAPGMLTGRVLRCPWRPIAPARLQRKPSFAADFHNDSKSMAEATCGGEST